MDDFVLPLKVTASGSTAISPHIRSVLYKKLIECLADSKKEIILNDNDVKHITPYMDDLPQTMFCMFEIVNNTQNGVLLNIKSLGGVCGANLMARFSHIKEDIDMLVKEIVRKEQELSSDAVLAEIVHLPEPRMGNILYRPHARAHEILYISNSDLSESKQSPMSDLYLSVQKGRLTIKSKKLKKTIIPRLTTAHNYRNKPLPVYHFLCDMQKQQGRSHLHFTWGDLEHGLTFLPRVRYKNTILSEAAWKIDSKEIIPFSEIDDNVELVNNINQWRKRHKMPQYVVLADGDNELFINWESPVSANSLLSIVGNRTLCVFKEFIFEEHTNMHECNNIFLNECIVAFHKDK